MLPENVVTMPQGGRKFGKGDSFPDIAVIHFSWLHVLFRKLVLSENVITLPHGAGAHTAGHY